MVLVAFDLCQAVCFNAFVCKIRAVCSELKSRGGIITIAPTLTIQASSEISRGDNRRSNMRETLL